MAPVAGCVAISLHWDCPNAQRTVAEPRSQRNKSTKESSSQHLSLKLLVRVSFIHKPESSELGSGLDCAEGHLGACTGNPFCKVL